MNAKQGWPLMHPGQLTHMHEGLEVINDARGASLTCGHLGGVVVCCRCCNQFVFDLRAFWCSGIVADSTKSTIVS